MSSYFFFREKCKKKNTFNFSLHKNECIIKISDLLMLYLSNYRKVQVGKDQEKAQSEKDSHFKNQGGKKPNQQSGTYTMKTSRKPNEQLFSQ